MFVVTVLFKVKEEVFETFLEALQRHAAASLTEEGCRRFDICVSEERREVFLFEAYDDTDAFAVHKATPHYNHFGALYPGWVTEKTSNGYRMLAGADAEDAALGG